MKPIALLVASLLIAACGQALPPPASTVQEPSPIVGAAPPPKFVTDHLAGARIGFVPLTTAQLTLVRVSAATAEQTALAIGPQPFGTEGRQVVWQRVGCVFLGWYRAPNMPSIGYKPPTFPAYLVEVIGDPVQGWPGVNVQAVVVNAQTGERDAIYGGSAPVMGTTCGVSA
jgi:hypothetical protein